jgi:hypothetical protein
MVFACGVKSDSYFTIENICSGRMRSLSSSVSYLYFEEINSARLNGVPS